MALPCAYHVGDPRPDCDEALEQVSAETTGAPATFLQGKKMQIQKPSLQLRWRSLRKRQRACNLALRRPETRHSFLCDILGDSEVVLDHR